MYMFHMVVKKEGGFTYPGVVFEKSAVMGVAPFAPVFITDSTENWGGSWLLLSNGQRMHINEGLQHVLEIFNIDETVIEKYMDRQDDAPFLL